MPRDRRTVLLIEDNRAYTRLVQECLREARGTEFDVEHAGLLAEGLDRLQEGGVDVVLLDLLLPDNMGTDTLDKVLHHAPDVPVIVFTSLEDRELAMEAVRAGAQDYLFKGRLSGELLVRCLRYAVETQRAKRVTPEAGAASEALLGRLGAQLDARFDRIGEQLAALDDARAQGRGDLEDKALDRLARSVDDGRRLARRLEEYRALADPRDDPFSTVPTREAFDRSLARLRGDEGALAARVSREPLPDVLGDPEAVTRLFELLLENAIVHAETPHPEVHVSVAPGEDAWTFTVEDDGPGIPEEELDRIFEPMTRLPDARARPGAGLGLAIARRIVETHGGDIWAEAPAGTGARIRFTLPCPPRQDAISSEGDTEAPVEIDGQGTETAAVGSG